MNKLIEQVWRKDDPEFKKKAVMVLIAVFFQGFFLSFLLEINLGQDPCSFMNEAISKKIGIQFGTWQLLLNVALFLFSAYFTGIKFVGIGMAANMLLVGYISDFFRWLWRHTLPDILFTALLPRIILFAITVFLFIIAAAVYMNCGMGTAPYDAVPFVISGWMPKVPFKYVRMAFDLTVVLIGTIVAHRISIATVIMALTIGPCCAAVGRIMNGK